MLLAEGIPGSVRRDEGRRSGTAAALAITQQRLAIFAMGEPLVDVTWDGGDALEIDVTARDDGLRIGFDDDRGGRTDLLLRIGDAPALLAAIDQRRRPLEPRRRRDG